MHDLVSNVALPRQQDEGGGLADVPDSTAVMKQGREIGDDE